TFDPWGRCTLSADDNTLVLRVEAADLDRLRRIQEVIARDLERFGRRDQLIVRWQPPDPPDVRAAATATSSPPMDPEGGGERRPRVRHRRMLLATAGALGVVLIVAVHLALVGVAIGVPHWLGWATAGVITVTALMAVLHTVAPLTALGVGRHAIGRRPRH